MFAADTEAPDFLLQVSCTGYDSPNAVQRVAIARGWDRTRILHLGHMGCYASLPAVAAAADLVVAEAARSPVAGGVNGSMPELGTGEAPGVRATVFVVELCTLHFRPEATDSEQIVQQALFADGAARIDITSAPASPAGTRTFGLVDHAEVIAPDSLDAMTWRVADGAFRMTLARTVPEILRTHLPAAVESLLAAHGLTVSDVPHWAVHPGGPKIIEGAAEALGLPDRAVRHSQHVLATRGNMSSATLPHIWAEMAADPDVHQGEPIVSLAFGPGLTVAMNLMVVA
jgi:predicted naringenin-chalcone synthase